ncbi:hypothetical protein TNCV_1401191 [Trichonephila clavipes]|nr:hypothetical protein TNCV_1401191 [Trichonephila clavipes]
MTNEEPRGHGHKIMAGVSGVLALMSLKTRRVKEPTYVQFVEAQSSAVGRESRSSEELTLAVRAPDSVTSFGMFARFRQSACARITRQEGERGDVKRQEMEWGVGGWCGKKGAVSKEVYQTTPVSIVPFLAR